MCEGWIPKVLICRVVDSGGKAPVEGTGQGKSPNTVRCVFWEDNAKQCGWGLKALCVLQFSRWELTCCRTRQETNVGMTMWLSQLLFFQIQSCCPPPPVPVLSFSRMHLLAAVWGKVIGAGHVCYWDRERGRERERVKGWVFWLLDSSRDSRGTTLGIYAEAYKTRLSWIHRGSTGIHTHFSFHTE